MVSSGPPPPAARELWIDSSLTSWSAYPTIFASAPKLKAQPVITDGFLPADKFAEVAGSRAKWDTAPKT